MTIQTDPHEIEIWTVCYCLFVCYWTERLRTRCLVFYSAKAELDARQIGITEWIPLKVNGISRSPLDTFSITLVLLHVIKAYYKIDCIGWSHHSRSCSNCPEYHSHTHPFKQRDFQDHNWSFIESWRIELRRESLWTFFSLANFSLVNTREF